MWKQYSVLPLTTYRSIRDLLPDDLEIEKTVDKKEVDGHLPSIRSLDDDDDLWKSMEDLMIIHGKLLKT